MSFGFWNKVVIVIYVVTTDIHHCSVKHLFYVASSLLCDIAHLSSLPEIVDGAVLERRVRVLHYYVVVPYVLLLRRSRERGTRKTSHNNYAPIITWTALYF